jgi:hypothetical protein
MILSYTSYVYVSVPNHIARKIKNDSIEWNSKWGDLYYMDEKGQEQKIHGNEGETDYKRHEDYEWDDEEESESEESDDEKCTDCGEVTFAEDFINTWEKLYSDDKHEGCDEENCPGKTCQYNRLCAACDCVLSKKVHIYCVGLGEHETTVCSDCFQDMVGYMRKENAITARSPAKFEKWVVDGNEDWENDETYSS